ncbi:MAG: hypothetical protein WC373_10620 [Smithella sp.]|jgi:hypothetical protein
MKKDSLVDDYLLNYSAGEKWKLIANDTDNVSHVVVIPALSEREMLFSTLASLARNDSCSLEHSFIICVVNNKDNSPAAVKENNRQTMGYLDTLVNRKSLEIFKEEKELYSLLTDVSDAKMKLGYMNASSEGFEIPRHTGGVGMARKIGMDMALRLLKKSSASGNIISSLDADTLVQNNYLSAIRNHFTPVGKTAIVAYEHQMPSDDLQQAAICCYEIFLRYWILGLRYANSACAFHSVGSTISVATEAYLAVRGMNKLEAGEDFYFLNKLAKIGSIDYIRDTCVYPSARSSFRVPFGTGKRIQKFIAGIYEEEYLLYNPRIFSILAQWLKLMHNQNIRSEDGILKEAGMIHPKLRAFLNDSKFPLFLSRIFRGAKDEKTLQRHLGDWFDAFRTLKLINYFTREVYPQINMFRALETIFAMSEISGYQLSGENKIPPLIEQKAILQYLRTIT